MPIAQAMAGLAAIAVVANLAPIVTVPLASFEPITVLAIDLMLVGIALAWAIRGTRRRLGRMLDRLSTTEAGGERGRRAGLPEGDRGETMAE